MMPAAAPLYPIFLSLQGLTCVVVGFGRVGQRKLVGLLDCAPAAVLVLDIVDPSPEAARLLRDPRTRFVRRALAPCDLRDCALVFATTNDAAENARIAALCAEHGVLCNSATSQGNVLLPAVARCGTMAAALSTGGSSPALARRWKTDLERWLAPRARMASFMGRLRPLVLGLNLSSECNADLFRTIAASPLQDLLETGDRDASSRLLQGILPTVLHTKLAELLDDLP